MLFQITKEQTKCLTIDYINQTYHYCIIISGIDFTEVLDAITDQTVVYIEKDSKGYGFGLE